MIYQGRYLSRFAWLYFKIDWQREIHQDHDSPIRDLFICCHNNRSMTKLYSRNSIWLDIQNAKMSSKPEPGYCMDCPVDWEVNARALSPPEGLEVSDEMAAHWRDMATIEAWYDLGTEGPAAGDLATRFTRLLSDYEQSRLVAGIDGTLLPQRIRHEPQSVRKLYERAEKERKGLPRF